MSEQAAQGTSSPRVGSLSRLGQDKSADEKTNIELIREIAARKTRKFKSQIDQICEGQVQLEIRFRSGFVSTDAFTVRVQDQTSVRDESTVPDVLEGVIHLIDSQQDFIDRVRYGSLRILAYIDGGVFCRGEFQIEETGLHGQDVDFVSK